MTTRLPKIERQQQILQVLAKMLANGDDSKITTANIAKKVGVSEATLYRHFCNKEEMFLKLIEFSEATIFSLINKINSVNSHSVKQIEQIIIVLLKFAENNPGIVHLIISSKLISKSKALGKKSRKIFMRIEAQFKQNFRYIHQDIKENIDYPALANQLLVFVIGKWLQFDNDGFKTSPFVYWDQQWPQLKNMIIGR